MSWFVSDPVSCPRCGHEFVVDTAETINVTRMPAAREAILDGKFHRESCPGCGASVHIDRAFLYTDVTRAQFVHVFPRSHVVEWPEWEEVAARTFWDAFHPAPPAMEELARTFTVRAVFGV